MTVAVPVRKDKDSRSRQDGTTGLQIEVQHYNVSGDEELVYRVLFADYLSPLIHAESSVCSK